MLERIHGDLFDFRQHVFADVWITRAKRVGVRNPFHGLINLAGRGGRIFVGIGGIEAPQFIVQIAVDESFDDWSMSQPAVDSFAALPLTECRPIDFKVFCDRQIW